MLIIPTLAQNPKKYPQNHNFEIQAEIAETTFVRSRFSDIQHGYDFIPSRIH